MRRLIPICALILALVAGISTPRNAVADEGVITKQENPELYRRIVYAVDGSVLKIDFDDYLIIRSDLCNEPGVETYYVQLRVMDPKNLKAWYVQRNPDGYFRIIANFPKLSEVKAYQEEGERYMRLEMSYFHYWKRAYVTEYYVYTGDIETGRYRVLAK